VKMSKSHKVGELVMTESGVLGMIVDSETSIGIYNQKLDTYSVHWIKYGNTIKGYPDDQLNDYKEKLQCLMSGSIK